VWRKKILLCGESRLEGIPDGTEKKANNAMGIKPIAKA